MQLALVPRYIFTDLLCTSIFPLPLIITESLNNEKKILLWTVKNLIQQNSYQKFQFKYRIWSGMDAFYYLWFYQQSHKCLELFGSLEFKRNILYLIMSRHFFDDFPRQDLKRGNNNGESSAAFINLTVNVEEWYFLQVFKILLAWVDWSQFNLPAVNLRATWSITRYLYPDRPE